MLLLVINITSMERDINDVFDDILLTEERAVEEGYEEGHAKGETEGKSLKKQCNPRLVYQIFHLIFQET